MRKLVRTLALPALLVLLVAGGSAVARPCDGSLAGDWTSDGYGQFLRITEKDAVASLELFEITACSCLPRFHAHRTSAPGESPAMFKLDAAPATIPFELDAKGDLRMQSPGAASFIRWRRAKEPPPAFGHDAANDPVSCCEVFWHTFAEQYGFFALRKIDWQRVHEEFRPKVTAATTPAQLFDLFQAMLEPLHDAHVSMRAPDLQRQWGSRRPEARIPTDEEFDRGFAMIDREYVDGALTAGCNGRVRFGRLRGSLAYVRIEAFGGYSPFGGFDATRKELARTLELATAQAAGCDALVIDVRRNGGGSDVLGLDVAARLTERDYVGFVKRARSDPLDPTRWTEPQTSIVRPAAGARFLGPVFLLTSSSSVSAAETFTMATLGREPKVVRVGEATQGVYSDVLERHLPNGWSVGLPNEIFLTEAGESFEMRGVPPDHVIPTFAPADLEAGKDAALERVFELLDDARDR